jgi:osmotically-inducible protein OsmY
MPEDHKTVHAVEKALAENETTKEMNFEHLHLSAVAGVVFLDGAFVSEEMRETVVGVIKATAGVRMVRDRTQINAEARAGGWKEPHQHPHGG